MGSSRVLLAVLLGAALVALTGCGPSAPVFLSSVHGEVVVLTCTELHVGSIELLGIDDSHPQGETLWLATGDAVVRAKDSFALGVPPSGLENEVPFDGLNFAYDFVGLSLQIINASGHPLRNDYARFDPDLVEEDRWLISDGRLLEEPC